MLVYQKQILERQLWRIANLLRGKNSADDYRYYILSIIFYNYLSENQFLSKIIIIIFFSHINKSLYI